MNQIKVDFTFKAPVEKVWAVLEDVEKSAEWVEGGSKSTRTSDVEKGVGVKWQEHCLLMMQNVPMDHTVTECEEGKHVVVETTMPMNGKMKRVFDFETVEESTKVSIEMTWDLGIASAFVSADDVYDLLESNLGLTLKNWRELVES